MSQHENLISGQSDSAMTNATQMMHQTINDAQGLFRSPQTFTKLSTSSPEAHQTPVQHMLDKLKDEAINNESHKDDNWLSSDEYE